MTFVTSAGIMKLWMIHIKIRNFDDCPYEVKESEIYKQIEECNKLNLTNPVDNNNTNSSTSYETHPSAIYTVEPKNLNENDDKNTMN
ncbi:hypothetical protein Glove_384g9 [Diversispora epigaea]|uniref:Uncharacterized protein n=1 Tax=Diversispora epigaea TaxID=1348612 RepID=A0A397HBF0_9GLOM|nr:hypothetical protein Glove_384g9 [Diversispora epigaea]